MPEKRGRPISSETTDPAQERKREAWRRQQQNRRDRQRAARTISQRHARDHLEQGEQVIDLTVTEEESAAATLLQLGLRVRGLTLPQDPGATQLPQDALDINEQGTLYPQQEVNIAKGQQGAPAGFFAQFTVPKNRSPTSRPNQRQLSQFYASLPASNPLASGSANATTQPNVSTHSSEEQRPSLSQRSTPITFLDNDNIDLDTGVSDNATGQKSTDSEERETEEAGEEVSEQDEVAVGPSSAGFQGRVGNRSIGSEDLLGQEQSSDEGRDEASGRSDDESEVNFASEHSIHSDDGGDTNEVSPDEYMVRKLYEQLQGGFHGCADEEHEDQHRQHVNDAGENHHGLRDISHDHRFPSVLGLQEMISSERVARQQAPTPAQWHAMFCGVPAHGRQRFPMNVCLHEEQTQAVEPEVAFDVDSFLGFADSLAMARKGLWYQPAPQMRQNMASDVHLETTIFQAGEDPEQPTRSRFAMLRDVPHFLLGRVEGAHDVAVFALFPHMAIAGEKFRSFTKDQHSRWADGVYLPALHKFYGAHYTQHIPASYRNAYDDSKAHQVEARQVQTSSYQAQQSIGYHLQPEHLDQIWNEVLETTANTPGLADFRDPELFFTAKGTKLQFKTSSSRPSLLDAMDYFQSYLEDIIDLDFVQKDRLYVDLGKEICARVSLVQSQQQHIGDEAQVYLWKRCCLERYIKWMYDDQPPAKGGRGQLYFTQNMLYDAGSLTSVSPKRSKHRQGGLIYSQFYASVKELYDATKCFPFTNDAMEELALDPQIRNAARNVAGGNRRDAKIVEFGYLASKQRARHALRDARRKSFGIREEHRIGWDLFQGLRLWLSLDPREEREGAMTDCPPYAWAIKTDVYLDFLWRSADKFATGFEVVRALSRKDLVTWEQTKIMAMFLRCLRYVFGGHLLSKESALWWGRRRRRAGEPARLRVWCGLGFRNTLGEYKYCWLEPRVDWGRLQFQSQVTDHMLFGNSVLRGQYLRRGGQVQAFFDMTRRLELALEWLQRYKEVEIIRDRMTLWVAHICLHQFRVDVLQCVRAEIAEPGRDEAMKGLQPFCFEWLDEVMADGVYLMSGNRCDFKVVSHLGSFLFDFDDGRARNHWEDRPFRKLYRRAMVAMGLQGRDIRRSFIQQFWRIFYQSHWILPYPCGEVLMQTTKQGRRMWYSIQAAEGLDARDATEWKWARKAWQHGEPRGLPRWIEWSKDEWERWIEERGGLDGEEQSEST